MGFALSRTVGRILDKAGAHSFANDLRKAVLAWASKLPSEYRDLHPDALAGRLFESDSEVLGPNRTKLLKAFEESNIPSEQDWFDAIEERRQEVYAHLGDGAQNFFKADFASVEPHIKKLAKILHQQCIKNKELFKVSLYEMVRELLERQEKPRPEWRPRPPDGLGVLSNVPELPQKFVARPEYLEPLKQKLLGKSEKTVAVTAAGIRKVGVQGMGGIGKTVLSAVAVREKEIRKAYPDGIIWLTLGQQPNLIARQVQLARLLGDQQAAFQDVQQGKARMEELLRNLACLVVLDDVWNAHHAAAFDVPGKKGLVLITTRFRNIVDSLGAQEQCLDVLEEDQAFALLAQWAGTTVEELPILSAHEVVKECGGLPLALAMIGAMIQRRPERWEDAVERLRSAGIDKIKRDFPDYPYPDLLRAIEVSIDGLDEIKDRYLDFAIFPEDTPIPEAILQTLWQADGLDKHDVQDVLFLLEDRSMLRRDEKGRITLHDLQFDYVRKQAGETLAARHGKLLDAYQAQCEDGWHTAPDDGYFYQHSAYHFSQAGRQDEFKKLLFDYRWLKKKLEVTEPNALIRDYDFLPHDPELQLVQGAVRLSAYILAEDKGQLAGHLTGRLLWRESEAIQALLHRVMEGEVGPWLRPLKASLTLPSGLLLRRLKGHSDGVCSVSVTSDNRLAISGSRDGTLKVWELRMGRLVRTLDGHEDWIPSLAVTPDDRFVVSGSYDKTLKVWDLQTGERLRSLEGHVDKVQAAAVTANGRFAVSGSADGTIKVWDIEMGREIRTIVRNIDPWNVMAAGITSGHPYMVWGASDGTLRGWWFGQNEKVGTDFSDAEGVNLVVVTPDNQFTVSKSDDGRLKVNYIPTGQEIGRFESSVKGVNLVAVTPDGCFAISRRNGWVLKVWDLRTNQEVTTCVATCHEVTSLAVTPDDHFVISGWSDGALKVWDLNTGQEVWNLEGHEGTITAIAVIPPYGRFVVSASVDNTLKVWDLVNGKCVLCLHGHESWVEAVAVGQDGSFAVSGSADQTLKIWDLADGKRTLTLDDRTGPIRAVTITSDDQFALSGSDSGLISIWDLRKHHKSDSFPEQVRKTLIASVSGGRFALFVLEDNTLKVCDLQTGHDVSTLDSCPDEVKKAAITPDGRYAVLGASNTLGVWNLQTGNEILSIKGLRGTDLSDVAITPNGHFAVSASADPFGSPTNSPLEVWDLHTGHKILHLSGHHDKEGRSIVSTVAITPDGRYAISSSYDCTLKIWDLSDGKLVRNLEGHKEAVETVVVTPDGRFAISSSCDCTLRFWDLPEGKEVRCIKVDTSPIISIAVAPDSSFFVSGSTDNTLKVWDFSGNNVLATFRGESEIRGCAVSPDGVTIVAGEESGRVHFLRLENVTPGKSTTIR